MRRANEAGKNLIKEFESLRLKVYNDANGHPTIGWGHKLKKGETFTEITKGQADALFDLDLMDAEWAVEQLVTVPLTDNQFSALVSFVYNCGADIDADDIPEGLGDSILLEKLNAGDYQGAANEFLKWRKSGRFVLKGLVRRREAEKALFLKWDEDGTH